MALLQHLYCHSYRLSGGYEKSHKLKDGDISDHRDGSGGHGDDYGDDYGDDHGDDFGEDYGEDVTWQKN